MHLASIGHEIAGLVGIREERHGSTRVDGDEVAQPLELRDRELGEIAEPFHAGKAGAALEAGGERLAQKLGTGCGRDPARGDQSSLAQCAATEHQRGRRSCAQGLGRKLDGIGRDPIQRGRGRDRPRLCTVRPGRVGGQDQRRDAAPHRREDRVGRGRAHLGRRFRRLDPAGDVAGHRLDVGRERRVEHLVIRGVVADDVDQRRAGTPRVVQIREPVAEPGPEVQERGGRAVGHAPEPVGSTGGHAFEQREHRAHLRHVVERGHEMHLGRAGVGEAGVDAIGDERP